MSEPSLLMFGDCVAHWDGSDVRVVRADKRICVDPRLLEDAVAEDWPHIAIDGPFLGIAGQVGYRATGEKVLGRPVYERVTPWPMR